MLFKMSAHIIIMGLLKKITSIHFKYGILLTVIVCFTASMLFPGIGPNPVIDTLLVFIGILFGIIVGFFISDLYSRFQSIKENAAIDASGLATYFSFAKLLVNKKQNAKWLEKQKEIIERYVKKFMPVPWEDYDVTEPEFTELQESLKDVEYKTDKENETYSNMLAVVSQISDAREKLVMEGKDHLTTGEWTVILFLGGLLLISLFYVKTMDIISVLFTWLLSASIIIMFLVIRDLDNLKFGESAVSIEPYERALDAIGRSRYYKK